MDFLMTPEGWGGQEVAAIQTAADVIGWASLAWAVGFALVALLLTIFATRVVRRRAFSFLGAAREVEVYGRHCVGAHGRLRISFGPPFRIRRV